MGGRADGGGQITYAVLTLTLSWPIQKSARHIKQANFAACSGLRSPVRNKTGTQLNSSNPKPLSPKP